MALTPMMRQYQDIKESRPDALLMFRLGDFYEMFFDDAIVASRELDITLTGRDAGEAGRIPMCGVPYHAVDQYLERLIGKGYRVAICEQVEDPKASKGLVQREIVRIVTPGTALTTDVDNRYLAAVVSQKNTYGLAFVDVGTGESFVGDAAYELCETQLRLWKPIELVVLKNWQLPPRLHEFIGETGILVTTVQRPEVSIIESQYQVASPLALGLEPNGVAASALSLVLTYVEDTQKSSLRHLQDPRPIFEQTHLTLNTTAMHHLELTTTVRDGTRRGSLLDTIDETVTAAGARLLRSWLERPLQDRASIVNRHQAVGTLVDDLILREEVRSALSGVHDLARFVARCAFGNATPKHLVGLSRSLQSGQTALDTLASSQIAPLLEELVNATPNLSALATLIDERIADDPPAQVGDGGIFRSGVDAQLDDLRNLQHGGRTWLRDLEQRERDKTGIKSLKVGYNKVFGYYIEVSKSNLQSIPQEYERRQTLAAAERFVLPELKSREAEILSAEERAKAHEYELFHKLCDVVLEHSAKIHQFSETLARIDVLQSLAKVASEQRYICPTMTDHSGIHVVKGRHPVVERLTKGEFVPNDTTLTSDEHIILLTGPNMGGKSTYMRQTALIVILAQMGSFVPAEHASIGIVDQIFARIGAADDLSRGQSTFMVEMIELADILRQATEKSLVLLDEIGRGTSTYDGLSIAESVVEELAVGMRHPMTMFATHYHELIRFSGHFTCVRNCSTAVEEANGDITFLHTVVDRPSDRSYGIQVARLAGLPKDVLDRAVSYLAARESSSDDFVQTALSEEVADTSGEENTVAYDRVSESSELVSGELLNLFSASYRSYIEMIAEENLLTMTPLESMNRLNQLVEEARGLLEWDKSK